MPINITNNTSHISSKYKKNKRRGGSSQMRSKYDQSIEHRRPSLKIQEFSIIGDVLSSL